MQSYLNRVVDAELATRLTSMGAVLIEGPRACGKTATAQQLSKSTIRLDIDETARQAVRVNPGFLFNRERPILFDEWQIEQKIWDLVRRQVDDEGLKGQFILTGSATPKRDERMHPGSGRVAKMRMRPMSLFESGQSSGEISLAALFEGVPAKSSSDAMQFSQLLQLIVKGGWPSLIGATESEASQWLHDYISYAVEVDVPALGTAHYPRNLRRLFQALARSVGQPVKAIELAKDVGGVETPLDEKTLAAYLDALERLHLTENSEAWQPHMRSKTRLRTSEVRYFVDPSLGVAALGVSASDLERDLNATGFHFESLAMRDVRVYAQSFGATVNSWRNANNDEVDAIVSLPDGQWGAFEIKLGENLVDKAAQSLRKLREGIDKQAHGSPAFLAVITGSGFGYRREDGVDVVPISALGP